jgi:hypothetical protein
MRVLLIDHLPLASSPSGRHLRALAAVLQAAGHEPRALTVAGGAESAEPFPVRTMKCGERMLHADFACDLPTFAPPAGQTSFADLTIFQIADYREAFRRLLDIEMAEFNPQVIHAQHVWLGGQLALESGAPYVLTAWGPELDCAADDPRYQPLLDQAAENASRILAVDALVARRLGARFESAAERVLCAGPSDVESGVGFDLPALYETILNERFGG